MLTEEVLARVCPRLPSAQRARLVPALVAALVPSSIQTPVRLAAFLGQCAYESNELRLWFEVWGPTPAQKRYEPPSSLATALGNVDAGDGYRYRGRGPMMITGRANYRRIGIAIGHPLELDPDLVATTVIGCEAAVAFWDAGGLSTIADGDSILAFRRLTRAINGGGTGLPGREAYHLEARVALGLAAPTP